MLFKTGPIGRAMVAAPTMVAHPSQTGRVAPLQWGGNGRATEGNPTGNEATRTPGAGLAGGLSILGGLPPGGARRYHAKDSSSRYENESYFYLTIRNK